MREPQIILQTVGDDPLTELMELDQIYGWTRRISVLLSIFEKRRRSIWPVIALGLILAIALAAVGTGAYLYLIS
jgi:hypothetical protein